MINFTNKYNINSSHIGLFANEELNILPDKLIPGDLVAKIKSFIKKIPKKQKKNIITFDLSENQKCYLVIIKKSKTFEINNLGGQLKSIFANEKDAKELNFFGNSKSENTINEFAYGFALKSYNFNKYKSKKNLNKQTLSIMSSEFKNLKTKYNYLNSTKEGVFLARDLVSEPPNVLNPKKYTEEIARLKKLGLKIEIFNESKLKKLGMKSLLGVGQGSENESYLVTIRWNGARKNFGKPLAFVGKGVCFDTGGISLKPARFMEEMKYDMGGSAVVVGLMKALALRKAKVNAVGIVGLVENMPDGNAQRPGDIVKSYSGKTIEVLNTDAEGRLVLADALTYTEKKYKPKFIIDLATLTGAIIMALGEEYAGLFSNNDKLSDQLHEIGNEINEKFGGYLYIKTTTN